MHLFQKQRTKFQFLPSPITLALGLLAVAMPLMAAAQDISAPAAATPPHGRGMFDALVSTAIFALVGTIIAILSYKLFDRFTPGDLSQEIIQNKNMAAAIVVASVILGVCLIVAAAIVG